MVDTVFAELAARLLADAAPEPDGGFDAQLWTAIADAGLDRLLLPEEQGGAGDAFAEAVAMMMAFGSAGAALPLADTLIANWCLSRAGVDLSEGSKVLLSVPDVQRVDHGWVGVGYWLPVASSVLAIDESPERVSIVTTGPFTGRIGETASGEPLGWVDPDTLPAVGSFETSIVPGQALAIAATFDAAAIVGALEQICTLSIAYANTRKQFGKPIGKFQAVQTLIAKLASEAAAARAAVEHAATELAGPNPLFWAGVAKARASEAAGKGAAYAHQVHGAIGFTREYELHRYTRRLWTWRERRGNERYWNQRIGSVVLAGGGQKLWTGLIDGLTL